MTHKAEIFSDAFAQKENFVTALDARIKIGFTGAALIINLLSPTIYTPLGIAVFCLFTLKTIRVPIRLLLLRLALPLVMAGVVLITQIFFYGTTPLLTITLGGLHLTGYEEGLARGILIMSRVLAGVLLVLFLSMSTPVNRLLMAAAWFRVPRVVLELALLMYRYIFVLAEEIEVMGSAQKVRLGYRNWRRSMGSVAILGGSLILRAYDRAERVFEAMLARGYGGNMNINYGIRPGRKDILAALVLGAFLSLFYFLGRLGI